MDTPGMDGVAAAVAGGGDSYAWRPIVAHLQRGGNLACRCYFRIDGFCGNWQRRRIGHRSAAAAAELAAFDRKGELYPLSGALSISGADDLGL